jgi:hypothetical protein
VPINCAARDYAMRAEKLYERIARDFEIHRFKDDWSFVESNEFVNPDFSERYISLRSSPVWR